MLSEVTDTFQRGNTLELYLTFGGDHLAPGISVDLSGEALYVDDNSWLDLWSRRNFKLTLKLSALAMDCESDKPWSNEQP